MSEKTNIDKVALEFITVYKRVKDRNLQTSRFRSEKELLKSNQGKRGRLDKIKK